MDENSKAQPDHDESDVLPIYNSLLLSIMLYSYDAKELEACLQSIFSQDYIKNFEVVICDDDASNDDGWEIANLYARKHHGKITISRNNISIGSEWNKQKGLRLCKGEYCVALTSTAEFNPVYIAHIIERLEADKFMEHSYIFRLNRANQFLPPSNLVKSLPEYEKMRVPLVSVLIYNFNYGRYLRQCLESVFAQTYENIEICFSDNASTDESWEIAMDYARKYPRKISLTLNRANFGPNTNLYNCILNMRGKYMLKLCSDDAIRPEFIDRCVSALESYPEAAFSMVHRDIMDESGQCFSEPPFYNKSCLIPGSEQAAVYMMSSVNPSVSQILYKIEKAEGKRMAGNLNDRWFGDRIMDFHICCDFPVVYIKEPLLLNRVHQQSESTDLDGNLLQCVGEYVLLHQLVDIAENYDHMEKARYRLQPGIEKLGRLCMRYCVRFLIAGDETVASRYFHLAYAIYPEIHSDPTYDELTHYWSSSSSQRENILAFLMQKTNLEKRTVSYPPPKGSIPC